MEKAIKNVRDISGWLFVPALILGIEPFRKLIAIIELLQPKEVYSFQTHQLSELPTEVLTFVLVCVGINVLLMVSVIYLATLFFKKKKKTPFLFIIWMISNTIITLLIYSVSKQQGWLYIRPGFSENTLFAHFLISIYAAVWVPYFMSSQRVKLTFVK